MLHRIFYSLRLLLAVIGCSLLLPACLKENPNPAVGRPSPFISVETLRGLYRGQDVDLGPVNLSGAVQFNGVVISDAASGNIAPGRVVIQNYGSGNVRGITLRLTDTSGPAPFAAGDSVLVTLAGGKLTRINGNLTITGIAASGVHKLGTRMATVVQTTLADLAANMPVYEGTLVQVNADITPVPAVGDVYSGDKKLFSGKDVNTYLRTLASAAFAGQTLPASATFTGIAGYGKTDASVADSSAMKVLSLRNLKDVLNPSGPLYPGFPEDFESPDASVKGYYAAASVDLKTGSWLFDQALFGNTPGRDRFDPTGKQCVRMQQGLTVDAHLQMNFDLANGASKVTLSYGAYYTDPSSSWVLESSVDQGVSWQACSPVIKDASATAKVATVMLNIKGPVRFRVTKLGLGVSNGTTILNGRLSIDNVAVFSN